MGLDMYLTGRKYFWTTWGSSNALHDRKEDGLRVKSLDVELAYWRKHPNLHGYIVARFGRGIDDCGEMELSADDIRNIIGAVKAKTLPHTEGFFFGSSASDPADVAAEVANDLKQLCFALEWLQASDDAPIETETTDGAGYTVTLVKPKPQPKQHDVRQRVSRSVHYQASW